MNLASWIIFFCYKEAQTITTGYEKEINPSSYTEEVDPANFYDQFNDSVLSETITKTVTDAEGSNLSQTTSYLRGKNKTETVTTYENDDFGRTVKENTIQKKYQDGRWLPSYETEVSYTYDENGNVTETETKSRKEGETDWQTQKTKAVYDSKGQVTKEYSPRGVKENVAAAYTYDLLGRKVKEELPQNKTDGSAGYQTVVNEYDKSGNLVETKEQIEGDKNKEIEYTYDKQGNLVQVKSSLENEKAQYVQYVYDEQGNKVRQFTGMTGPLTVTVAAVENDKDDAGKDTFTYGGKTYAVLVTGKKKSDTIRETKYVYDTKNRLVSYTDPEGRTETYTYDCNSNLTKTVDKNGNTLKNTYDNKNRLTERTAKEKKTGKETVYTYRYNAYGDVAVQDDTQFLYGDVSGQVTKETTKLTKNKDVVKNYTYDSNGNKSTFSVKAGEDTKLSLSYEYDGSSRLISVKDSEENQAVSYAYDTEGSLSERQAANGLKTTYGYDYQNRLTSMTNETGKGVVSKYSSTYLKNGQKAEEVSTIMDKNGKSTKKTAAYTYDMLGRITRETKTGREDISYTYDANNNRKQMTIGNKTTAYQYNKNDELLRTDTLHTDTEKNDVVIYKNDKNGNQLATVNRSEIPAEAKDTSYIDVDVTLGDNQLNDNVVNHYNALNQLTETPTKNYKVSFTYDAEGLRSGKTVNGEKTVYVWNGDQVVMELSKGGAVQKRYIRGNDLVYADKGENTEKTYYATDMHGNVVQLLDESGNVTKTYEYDSFGNEVKPEKKDENPYRYCGEYYDKETEEVYLRARYYEPGVGRFITRDTYTGEGDEPLSLHLYTYCENDGVNMVDPSGHDSYVIYDKDAAAGTKGKMFSDEAKIVQKRLKRKYKKPCYLLTYKTAKDFKRIWAKTVGFRVKPSWNKKQKRLKISVKKAKVNEVYIISHGSITGEVGKDTGYMYCSSGKSRIYARRQAEYDSQKDVLVTDLKRKNIQRLVFSCCNTANPDCYNIANAFIRRMAVKEVVGFDGGARFDYDDNKLKKGFDANQNTWLKYVKTKCEASAQAVNGSAVGVARAVRKRMGRRVYKQGHWSAIDYY